MKENTDLDVLVMSLKSGEYDGTSIMQAWIAIERLMKIEEELDTHKSEWIAYKAALENLEASLPKIKADAVKEIAKTNKCELNIPSYPESVVVCYFDDLMDDANKLEAGE